jgi:hypothetical protein
MLSDPPPGVVLADNVGVQGIQLFGNHDTSPSVKQFTVPSQYTFATGVFATNPDLPNPPSTVTGTTRTYYFDPFGVNTKTAVRSVTGYPMCLPKQAPPTVDPDCPFTEFRTAAGAGSNALTAFFGQSQRPFKFADAARTTVQTIDGTPGGAPVFETSFTMNAAPPAGTLFAPLNSRRMAPLVVGDFIRFSGILSGHPGHPNNGNLITNLATETTTGVSEIGVLAWEVVAHTAIYTAPGDSVAYTAIDNAVYGTKGLGDAAAAVTHIEVRGCLFLV